MTITRKDLEYAAKACGIKGAYNEDRGMYSTTYFQWWAPHNDEADCWRMCRQLRLNIDWSWEYVCRSRDDDVVEFGNDTGLTDMEAATLVAAQIGRAL
jgi:hypothetical protein